MKLYDISQEVFTSAVYPGDPSPRREVLSSIEGGDLYNLTAFSMCAHNGTHIDAPYHFFGNGKTVDRLPLSKTVGMAFVAECKGELTADSARAILRRAERESGEAGKRILLKGDALVTLDAARILADAGIDLLGTESQTVGPEDAPMAVHKALLSSETVLLEGLRLGGVAEGVYLLSAAPLSLADADGAPCRAVLIDLGDTAF